MRYDVSDVQRRNVQLVHPALGNDKTEVLGVRIYEGSLHKAVVPKIEELFCNQQSLWKSNNDMFREFLEFKISRN